MIGQALAFTAPTAPTVTVSPLKMAKIVAEIELRQITIQVRFGAR
jgi:hypothetical protein